MADYVFFFYKSMVSNYFIRPVDLDIYWGPQLIEVPTHVDFKK